MQQDRKTLRTLLRTAQNRVYVSANSGGIEKEGR
jgi:hypothetical protein